MMAIDHPRRYLSLSVVGAIAMRLPATSSRMYTSSVSEPLAKTSKTSSATSRVVSGRPSISCSTAERWSRCIEPPRGGGKPIPNPQPGQAGTWARPEMDESGRAADRTIGFSTPRQRKTVEVWNERVRWPRTGRYDGDPGRARCDRRDAREKRVDLGARDQERDRSRDVAPAPGRPIAPALDPGLRHEPLAELAELDDAGRAVGALATCAIDRVAAVKTQELYVHLDRAPKLGEGRVDERRVGGEPGVEVLRIDDHPEPERHGPGGIERRRHDVMVKRERPRVGLGESIEPTDEDHEVTQAPELDGVSDARGRRTPRRREAVGDRVEVLVHAAPRAPDGAPQVRGEFRWCSRGDNGAVVLS